MSTATERDATADIVRLEREGIIAALDAELARLVDALDPAADPWIAIGTAYASRAIREGHSCLPLDAFAADLPADLRAALPPLDSLRAMFRVSPLVGSGDDERRELYLDDHDRLYLGRYFHYERAVARALARLVLAPPPGTSTAQVEAILARHFAGSRNAPDWQRVAVATGALSALTVITGGPGTGKTTTVQWLLACLIESASEAGSAPPRITLAAPTGKAATRLSEALRAGRDRLDVGDAIRALIPTEALTIHRLLGARRGSTRFRHRAGRPVDADIVVVDEVSMVDLPLMAALLDALPKTARLVLLGDRDQLASVEAGNVLAAICEAAASRGVSHEHAAALRALGGDDVPQDPHATRWSDVVVELRASHRFGDESALGCFARAIRDGDAGQALMLLASEAELSHENPADADPIAAVVARHIDDYVRIAAHDDPACALAEAARLRVLCALRHGPRGVIAVNEAIERALRMRAGVAAGEAFYAGRLIIVTENAYDSGLYNGDIGIIARGTHGNLVAWFPSADGVTSFPLAALPAHESAFAITIHKSQGSEFDQITVVLPDESSPILGRELLYTAITRARQRVHLVASTAALEQAIATSTRRHGGLADALRDMGAARG